MRNFSDSLSNPAKRLGGYLVEAGLLTKAQVDVALNDQKLTGMRFGEILAARGWVKQQTIDFVVKKVIQPERQADKRLQARDQAAQRLSVEEPDFRDPAGQRSPTALPPKPDSRRELPIAKPLPSVAAADSDVSWVG